MKKIVLSLFLAVLAFTAFAEDITPPKLVHSPVKQAMVNSPIEIGVIVRDMDSPIDAVTLFYRQVGEDGFVAIPMDNMIADAERFSAEIPATDVTLSNIEYFIRAADEAGNAATYPEMQAMENPLLIKCVESGEKTFVGSPFVLLSPEPGADNLEETIYIVAFYSVEKDIDRNSLQFIVDKKDLSGQIELYDNTFTYLPKKVVKPGKHEIIVRANDKNGKPIPMAKWEFRVAKKAKTVQASLGKYASGDVEATTEMYSREGDSETTNKLRARVRGGIGFLSYNARVFLTSEEDDNTQPFNRYVLNLKTNILSVGVGDVTPSYSKLTLNGKRVRGFNADMQLGVFGLHAAMGQTKRSIEGNASTLGTYEQNLLAARINFGRGQNFRWGFTALKVKDDKESIEYGESPKDNVVLGTDIKIAFAKERVVFNIEGATSLYNYNTDDPVISKDDLDTLGIEDLPFDPQDYEDIFVINQNIAGIPGMGTSAFNAGMKLFFFNNLFKAEYRYGGNAFNNLANSSISKDKKGFLIKDVLRLLDNRLTVSGQYATYQDNLQEDKLTTTDQNNYQISANYFAENNMNFSLGFGGNSQSNDADPGDAVSALVDNEGNNYNAGFSMPFRLMDLDWRGGLSLANSTREDKGNAFPEETTSNYTFNLQSDLPYFAFPCRVMTSYSRNQNEYFSFDSNMQIAKTDYSSNTLFLKTIVKPFDQRLTANFSLNSTFYGGEMDGSKFKMSTGAAYKILNNLKVNGAFRYITSSVADADFSETKVELGMRYNF